MAIVGLQAFLVDQKKTFNDSLEVSKSAARVYTKYATTLETQGYFAGIECKLQLAQQAAQFYDEMKMIHEVLRSSSAMVCNEEALTPFRDFVVKVGDGVAELDKQRRTRLLDYDAHKRRHKALEDKSHSSSGLSNSEQGDLNKFAQKLKDDDEGIKMITDAEDDTIRRSKMEHDALMDDFIVILTVCQARLFNAAGERLNALVAKLPPEKVKNIQDKIDDNIKKGGALVTDQKSATRVALDAVAGKTTVAEAASVFIGGAPLPPLPSNAENTTKGALNLPSSSQPLLNFSAMGKSFFGNSSSDDSKQEVEKSADIPDIDKMEKLDLSGANAPPVKPHIAPFTAPLPTPQGFAEQQAANSAVPDPTYGPAYFPRDIQNIDGKEIITPQDPSVVANTADFSGYNKGSDLFNDNDNEKRDTNPFGPAEDVEKADDSIKGTNPFGQEEDLSALSESTSAPPPEPPRAPPARPPSLPLSAPPSIPTYVDAADVSSHLQSYIDPISSPGTSKRNSKGLYPRVVALYDSKPEESDELEFYKGDIIEVLEGDNEGWSKGMLRGIQGMFPSNYVEPYTD